MGVFNVGNGSEPLLKQTLVGFFHRDHDPTQKNDPDKTIPDKKMSAGTAFNRIILPKGSDPQRPDMIRGITALSN
jgi:hypothetical protein